MIKTKHIFNIKNVHVIRKDQFMHLDLGDLEIILDIEEFTEFRDKLNSPLEEEYQQDMEAFPLTKGN